MPWLEVETDTELTRELNQRMAETGRAFANAGDATPMDFLCECACGGRVSLTVIVYDGQDGAWIPGHEPVAALHEIPAPATL